MKDKRDSISFQRKMMPYKNNEMSFKTPPISPMRGSVSQFFSNNDSYEEDISIFNELNLNKTIFSEKKINT